MALNWLGGDIKKKINRAARLGIDATMSAAIQHAKKDHGSGAHGSQRFVTRTAELERSTRIVKPARTGRGGTVGRWGTIGLVYARRIELGFQGKDAKGRVIDAQPYPYLRPAAQVEYPKLAKRIKKAANFA